MRFLPHLLAAVLATTTVSTSIADACGGYVRVDPAPRVLAVSTHTSFNGARSTSRAFVVLEQPVQLDAKTPWQLVAPRSYDNTQIFTMSPLANPMEVTLVGPSGARVIKTAKQVALKGSWQIGWDKTRIALEAPVKQGERFAIAIAGRAADATWGEIEYHEGTAATTWWLGQQGIKDPQYVGLRTIKGMAFDIVEYSQGDTTHFVVRDGDRTVGLAANGRVLGSVTTNGRSFLVFDTDGQIRLLELPKASLSQATKA
jgi:hypothetical protein